jgi:hypothetical protein
MGRESAVALIAGQSASSFSIEGGDCEELSALLLSPMKAKIVVVQLQV